MSKCTEDDLKKSQKESRDELRVKVFDIYYEADSGMTFCSWMPGSVVLLESFPLFLSL